MLHNDHEAGSVIFSGIRNLQCLCYKVSNEVCLMEHLNFAQSTFCKCTLDSFNVHVVAWKVRERLPYHKESYWIVSEPHSHQLWSGKTYCTESFIIRPPFTSTLKWQNILYWEFRFLLSLFSAVVTILAKLDLRKIRYFGLCIGYEVNLIHSQIVHFPTRQEKSF